MADEWRADTLLRMPNGLVNIVADEANAELAATLRDRLGAVESSDEQPDLLITTGVPAGPAANIVITGVLTDALDEWDRQVRPQTLAGALWVPADQDSVTAICGWWLLRHETPTTPLSDLTDANERALRWSVVGARSVLLPQPAEVAVDDEEIRSWLDDQPQVQALGTAIERVGGDTAEAVLAAIEAYRASLAELDGLADLPPVPPSPALDTAVAAHLREVQRSGFGRWRGGKVRAQTKSEMVAAAKDAAADRLRDIIAARRTALSAASQDRALDDRGEAIRNLVSAAVSEVELPCAPDFGQVPRSWGTQTPDPRRYVLMAEEHADRLVAPDGVTVRFIDQMPDDQALCLVVQSGFSLPAIR